MTHNDPVLDRMLTCYNRGDVDGVLAEATDNVEYVLGSRGLHLVGREAWGSVMLSVSHAIPGRRMHVRRRLVAGDVAVVEWVIEGVSSGQVAGYPGAGELVRREGCSVVGFHQGQIVSFRDYVD